MSISLGSSQHTVGNPPPPLGISTSTLRPASLDLVSRVPDAVGKEILSQLGCKDLAVSTRVSKQWKSLTNDKALWHRAVGKGFAFGKAEWAKFFGDIGVEPPLPPNIVEVLKSPCPFWPDKKVGETHTLVFIPKTVNGKPLTLKTLREFVKAPKVGTKTDYDYIWDRIEQEHGDKAIDESGWVLMTKVVIPNSRKKSYEDQQKLVANRDQNGQAESKERAEYQVPTTLEAAVCILVEHIRSGKRLFSDSPLTYTRCQESTDGYRNVVGGFAAAGLILNHDSHFDDGCLGVAATRKWPLELGDLDLGSA